jgi:hypothetical protein
MVTQVGLHVHLLNDNLPLVNHIVHLLNDIVHQVKVERS